MKILFTAITAGFIAILLYLIHALDDWLGILAYNFEYVAFCLLIIAAIIAAWSFHSKSSATIAGVTTSILLLTPFLLETPSSRILRKVMLNTEPGTSAYKVEEAIRDAYNGSQYAMPGITKTDQRIDISLLTQKDRYCTSLLFHVENGVVTTSSFIPD